MNLCTKDVYKSFCSVWTSEFFDILLNTSSIALSFKKLTTKTKIANPKLPSSFLLIMCKWSLVFRIVQNTLKILEWTQPKNLIKHINHLYSTFHPYSLWNNHSSSTFHSRPCLKDYVATYGSRKFVTSIGCLHKNSINLD